MTSLGEYARTLGDEVYLSAYLRTSAARSGALTDASGDKVAFGGDRYVVRPDISGSAMKKMISAVEGCGVDGVCAEDASADVFASARIAPDDIARGYSSACETVSGALSLMSGGAHLFGLTASDCALGVPLETSAPACDAFAAEPFSLAVLHGCVEYTGSPVNEAEIPRLAMLKCVEYGCSPCVRWSFSPERADYYENGFSDYVDYILESARVLGDLTDCEITDHYAVRDGVFCTEYASKTLVYVNYNNYSAVIGDVVVPPYGFLRLN